MIKLHDMSAKGGSAFGGKKCWCLERLIFFMKDTEVFLYNPIPEDVPYAD